MPSSSIGTSSSVHSSFIISLVFLSGPHGQNDIVKRRGCWDCLACHRIQQSTGRGFCWSASWEDNRSGVYIHKEDWCLDRSLREPASRVWLCCEYHTKGWCCIGRTRWDELWVWYEINMTRKVAPTYHLFFCANTRCLWAGQSRCLSSSRGQCWVSLVGRPRVKGDWSIIWSKWN